MVLVFPPLTLNLEESMKNIKQSRRKIKAYLEDRNIFDAAIHHNGGKKVVLSMPPTAEATKLIRDISARKIPDIKCSNGNNLEIKAPSLNYLKNFFRRNMSTGQAEPVLD